MNGYEYLLVHRPQLWHDVQQVIESVDAEEFRTKKSTAKQIQGKLLYDPKSINNALRQKFNALGWYEKKIQYYTTDDPKIIRETMHLDHVKQRAMLEIAGVAYHKTSNQTDFQKERVAVEVQFGHATSVAHDLFVKHLAFYAQDAIDVGIEIVGTKQLNMLMSSSAAEYERALYHLVRLGRGVPGVPLVLLGIQ